MNILIDKLNIIRKSLRLGCVGLALAVCMIAPLLSSAQAPWNVTVVPTMNPLPIGLCAAIHLTVLNPSGGDVPRNARGIRVTMADFDIAVSAPNGSAAAQQIDAYHWSVCGCQGGVAGTVGTVTATYPARALPAESRVPNVSFQQTATFVLGPAVGTTNSLACQAAKSAASSASPTGGTASSSPPASTSVATTLVAPLVALAPTPTLSPVTGSSIAVTPQSAKGAAATKPVSEAVAAAGVPPAATLPVGVVATPSAPLVALEPVPATTSAVLSPAPIALSESSVAGSGTVPTSPTAPPAPAAPVVLNPTGFTAKQEGGPDQVDLEWQPVTGASYYAVFGPGLPAGGAKIVGITKARATGVAPGNHQWTVASYYEPGPVTTAASEFPKVTLNVTAPYPPIAPTSTAKWTNFNPVKYGFRFVNDFVNNFIGPPVNWQTNGLCGGMTYAVLDYYYAGRPIPNQEYRPANATPLQMYLYGRQVTSLVSNLDKWTEYTFNPFGARNTEFFNWGINERLLQVRLSIDLGVPAPLGLKGGLLSVGTLSHDHQVLAIGYDIGRYKMDLGDNIQDVKIYVLDPNHPTKVVTLVPDPVAKEYHYVEYTNERWRSYFVDGKYQAMPPPNIANPSYPGDGLAHELLLRFVTGADDLRGGADHADVTITLSDNTTRYFPNISRDGRWLHDTIETAQIALVPPIAPSMIKTIAISTNATGGISGDNWDLTHVTVTAVGGGFTRELADKIGPYPGALLHRFTGAQTPLVLNVN